MHLSTRDVARIFNATEGSVEKWVSERNLPAVMVNRRLVFNRAEVLEWAEATGAAVSPNLAAPWNGHSGKPSLVEALSAGGVHDGLEGSDKESALTAAVNLLDIPKTFDRRMLLEMIKAREASGSTGIGHGIAIPHPNKPIVLNVDKSSLALFYLAKPVDFKALDGKPVGIMFLMISPTVNAHLHLLSRLASTISQQGVRDALDRKAGLAEMTDLFRKAENAFA